VLETLSPGDVDRHKGVGSDLERKDRSPLATLGRTYTSHQR